MFSKVGQKKHQIGGQTALLWCVIGHYSTYILFGALVWGRCGSVGLGSLTDAIQLVCLHASHTIIKNVKLYK